VSVEELILHIGYPKTGTSAIQDFCYKNRETLLKSYRIYYPNTYGPPAHYIHSFVLMGEYPQECPHELKLTEDYVLLNLKKEIEESNPQKVLISSEYFIYFPYKPFKLHKLIEIINPNSIKVICYIRRQDKIIESSYMQALKTNPLLYCFKSYLHSIDRDFDYYRYLRNLDNTLKKVIDRKFITINYRLYLKDINKDWNVIDDFCDLIGIQKSILADIKLAEINISHSPTSNEALKKIITKYLFPWDVFYKIVNFLYEYDKQYPSRIKTLMPLDERKRILDFYRESNEKLFREYFNQENQFFLSKEEEEFYEEQESIPKEEIEREIEEKYRSILEFIKNESFLPRTKIFTYQIFGFSEFTQEFIRGGLISDWVGGHIDVCNEEKIAGWLLDLKDKEPCFLVKLNGIVVHVGRPSLERVDIKDIYGIDWYAGFSVLWKDIKLPEQILALSDDAEIEVEVIHEKTGYVIPGNYKKILKKDLIAKIKECEKPKAEIRQILTLGSKKLIYIYLTVTKPASEALFTQTDITDILITYLPDNQEWNLLCIAPKDTTSIPLVIKYLDGSEEKIEVKI